MDDIAERTSQARLSFRPASAADAAEIVALVESAYRGESSRAGWTTEADLLDGQRTDIAEVTDLLAAPDVQILVARDADGALVGCCQLERRGPTAYFGMFAVSPTRQSGGVGASLLDQAERHARRAWGSTRMEMLVISLRAELLAWYDRRGYSPSGQRQPFPHGDPRFGIPRQQGLEFVVLTKDLRAAVVTGPDGASP